MHQIVFHTIGRSFWHRIQTKDEIEFPLLSLLVHHYLTIRLRARVFYEQLYNNLNSTRILIGSYL